MLKRTVDIGASALGLLILLPVLVLIALAVKLSSPGPVLFRQVRVGRSGRDFRLNKFRSMTVRAGTEGGSFDLGSSARVTAVGRLLRATKLDELPQLWNVLRGDMSLVGPRPEIRRWVDAYPERWERVLRVRPGITDPASIVYRHEEQILAAAADPERAYRDQILPHKLDLYEAYVGSASLRADLAILLRTALAIFRSEPSGS